MPPTILIVDDDAIARLALSGILEAGTDWRITEAGDGRQALDLLEAGLCPDICVVDVRMPVLDGLEFTRRVRESDRFGHLKIVVSSGGADRDSIIAFARLRVSGFLPKPCSAEKALGVLRPLVRISQG
jgi:two-component system chemotaxis response regulator CheY